jgi:hypothetical protein
MVSKVQQWEEGSWNKTVAAVGVGARLYSVERDGTLYATHAVSGESKVIGEGYNTRLLVANGLTDGDLFAIERNGNLYKIDRKTGEWEALSEDGDWSDTVAGDAAGNILYTVERDGTLYATDLDNFDEDSVELDTGYDTRALWAWGDHVYVLENDGSLYKVHGESGESERFGDAGAYSDTLAATIHNGVFYAVEDDGALGATSLEDASYVEHDDEDFGDVRHLFSAAGKLYAIEKNGTLSMIDLG